MTKARDLSQIPNATLAFRNRIINGAMMIDQRNAGASVTPANAAYTLDRWQVNASQSSKLSIQQSTVAPAGFTNSLLVTSLATTSLGSTDFFAVFQPIEGNNCSDLGFGTAVASSITVSFWVRSSLTGVFGASVWNDGQTRCYPFSYTINAANTWEQKFVTIAGDTSGTWLKNNGRGMSLYFALGVGSTYSNTAGSWYGSIAVSTTGATSVVGTNGATFYITGVQLEKGSTATSFDYRPYGTELALCQRYFYTTTLDTYSGFAPGTTSAYISVPFKTTMRARPTGISVVDVGGGSLYTAAGGNIVPTSATFIISGINAAFISIGCASGLTAAQGTLYYLGSTTMQFTGAEL